MSKRNLLIAIDTLIIAGGAEKTVAIIAKHLSEKKYKKILFTRKIKKEMEISDLEYLKDLHIEYLKGEEILYPSRADNLRIWREIVRKCIIIYLKIKKRILYVRKVYMLKKICKKHRIDTVLSFMEKQNFRCLLSKILFFNKPKLILSIRTTRKYNRGFEKFFTFFYRFADKVVVLSNLTKKHLEKRFWLKNVEVIKNSLEFEKNIELSKDKILKEEEKYFNGEDFVFINVARNVKQKCKDRLIRSFKKVVEENKNCKLLLSSDPINEKGKKILEELILKLNLEKNVFFINCKRNIFPYVKKSNCFILTSRNEGFPNALAEALNLNIPIISTDCHTGPREILEPNLDLEEEIKYPYFGKYGILMEVFEEKEQIFKTIDEVPLSKQEEELANIMIRMMNDEKLQKRYSNGIERAKDFNCKKIMKLWEKVL